MTWIDDLDFDPTGSHLKMGTRSLGARPWLVSDERTESELSLRRELLHQIPEEVVVEPHDAGPAAAEVEALVAAEGVEIVGGPSALWRLGASVQEDLCLLERHEDQWVLRAAVLCFPSRWRLAEKIDKPLLSVHEPVAGYAAALGPRVDRLISGLGERVVLRRNWFIHPDPALFQPDRPVKDPVVDAQQCRDGLFVRSERQTLRLLPDSGWCVFTIRIQQCSLGQLVDHRAVDFGEWLRLADPDDREHRGLPPDQANEVRSVLN